MGWSCEWGVGEDIDALMEALDGSYQMWEYQGHKFYFDLDTSREYPDGRAKLDIYRVIRVITDEKGRMIEGKIQFINSCYLMPGHKWMGNTHGLAAILRAYKKKIKEVD